MQVRARSLSSLPHRVFQVVAATAGWLLAFYSLTPKICAIDAHDDTATPRFVRGDANHDGTFDLTDPLVTLSHLFLGSGSIPCADAADADDDGSLSLTDAIVSLETLFLGSGPLPAPHPNVGIDSTADSLGCGPEDDPLLEPLVDPRGILERRGEDIAPVVRRESSTSASALEVSPETFAALADWPPGERLRGGRKLAPAGLVATLDALGVSDRRAPVVAGRRVTVPLQPGDCWTLPARRLAGFSFDPDRLPGRFVRGDVDLDGDVDLHDLELAERCLVRHESIVDVCLAPCPDAWDADDNGVVDRQDFEAIHNAVVHGLELPPPGVTGSCGRDPTPDELGACDSGYCSLAQDGLTFEASPERICEPGEHPVRIRVRDRDGYHTDYWTVVRTCDPLLDDCAYREEDRARRGRSAVNCRWIHTTQWTPDPPTTTFSQTVFSRRGTVLESRSELPPSTRGASVHSVAYHGPGPYHFVASGRRFANCRTPEISRDAMADGRLVVRAHRLCWDEEGRVVESGCEIRVQAEGVYDSFLEADSAARSCGALLPRVESSAVDEASFHVQGMPVFAKALALQNGTSVSWRPGFTVSAGQQADTTGKLAGNTSVAFAISQSVDEETGTLRGVLRALGIHSSRSRGAVTLVLEARGHARVLGNSRSGARALVETEAAGMWLCATAPCSVPGAGGVPWLRLYRLTSRDGERRQIARETARQFFAVQPGSGGLPPDSR